MKKIQSLTELTGVITQLPRGGYLVDTSEGYIQFGSPPETLKDTIRLPQGVPTTFVLPMEHFDPKFGMSVAEIEFPIYWNFFLKKKKTRIYTGFEHIANMRLVLSEAVFGPRELDLEADIEKTGDWFIPDLASEMRFFAGDRKLEDMVDIMVLDKGGFDIGAVHIAPREDGSFDVSDKGSFLVNVPAKVNFNALFDLGATLKEPFIPPEFGITCLGPSHGFDPTQNTSGFILWINKVGIMVDPPANSTLWLKDSNVNPKLIDSVILTHCHADHDSGTFQKILEETKITIYTTPTVMQSFLRKYSALTHMSAKTLIGLFNFAPVKMFGQYNIHGAIFSFYYTLHSIPTIGFRFHYRNKTFIYSSDHLNEPSIIRDMHDKGIINERRMKNLLEFPWETDIIYHEAGIPPLHTPVSYLNTLPPEIQKKVTVYHIAEKDFPEKTDLRLARFGIGETVYPDVEKHQFEEPYDILDVFSRIDVFRDLPFDRIKDLLLVVRRETFTKGEYIIRKDTPGDKFYVIISGNVSIGGVANVSDKVYATYEYFGEASLLLNTPRKADVIAMTSVEAYSIDKESFLRLIDNTTVEDNIRRVASIRDGVTWNVIKANPYFKNLSSSQVTQLEALLQPCGRKRGDVLQEEGETVSVLYMVIEGLVEESRGGRNGAVFAKGDMLGDFFAYKDGRPSPVKLTAKTDLRLYQIRPEALLFFLENNPGVYMSLLFDKGQGENASN